MNHCSRLTLFGVGGIICLLCALLLPAAVHAADAPDYLPGEVVVKLFNAADLPGVAADYALEVSPISQFGTRPIFRLRILDGQEPPLKAAQLAGDGRVEYAEPNYLHSTPEGQKRSSWARVEGVTNLTDQWAAAKIRLPAAHTVGRGAGVIVAVLDTGIDARHPAFAGRIHGGYDFVDMDPDPSEVFSGAEDLAFGHGTHVAGLVALAAPEARLMPLRVLNGAGEGNVWVLAEALAFAVNPDGDLATDDGADVINLSLSTGRRTDFLDEILSVVTCSAGSDDEWDDGDENDGDEDDRDEDDAGSDQDDDYAAGCLSRGGAVVVAAAGNNGASVPEYPAAEGSSGLLAVAATGPTDTRSIFSNYGPWVSLGAPGEAILSAIPNGAWGAWSGTSMAVPLVAGTAALVRAQAPYLTPAEVAWQITATAAPMGGDLPVRLDAAAALGLLR
jgi:subtilisin family serine protease